MGKKAKKLDDAVRLLWTKKGWGRMFRNFVGLAWTGKLIDKSRGRTTLLGGSPIKAGLTDGASDCIGWTSRLIRQDDVGRRIAVFTAVEGKSKGDTISIEQRKFLRAVKEAGGVARVAREKGDKREIDGIENLEF